MKCVILPSILGEMRITRKLPYATQVLIVVTILICIAMFVLQGDSGQIGGVAGMCWASAWPLTSAMRGTLLEMTIRGYAAEGENKKAEQIRVLLASEIWRAFFTAIWVLTVEWEFVERGLVNGWTPGFLLGAVLPVTLTLVANSFSVATVGSLRTNIFAAADIGLAYKLEGVLFQRPVELQPFLAIVAVTLLILVHTAFGIDLRKHAASEQVAQVQPSSQHVSGWQRDVTDVGTVLELRPRCTEALGKCTSLNSEAVLATHEAELDETKVAEKDLEGVGPELEDGLSEVFFSL